MMVVGSSRYGEEHTQMQMRELHVPKTSNIFEWGR